MKFNFSPLITRTPSFCFRALKNFDPIAKEVNSAVLAINDVINYFNVRDKSLEVKPGNEVKIIIRPSIQTSTPSFATLGLDSEKENLNFIVTCFSCWQQ